MGQMLLARLVHLGGGRDVGGEIREIDLAIPETDGQRDQFTRRPT
jgi:hypothetical protein